MLSVIGEDATKAFDAFEWGETKDDSKIEDVLAKFDEYCDPRTQVIYQRYRFNKSTKKPGNQVRFQVDTGSECNLLPTKLYKSLTGDTNLSMLRKCNKSIVSYTGERRQIAGKINLRVWHKRSTQTLTFNVIDGEYQPILSLNTSIALGIVTFHDCDVLSLTISSRSNAILEEFKDAFEGLG
ncbi:unnamed protein product [Porites lobata]|uniref:Peptidase A2 domain-containing protein n=1 Tax=Porites lobata TaxID=104759 RepID=A0ABN8P8T8_9CNID|nr:unnamed protein product [Porites lobata]